MKFFVIWLLAAAVALLLSCTYLLDGPSELDAVRDTAADVRDAQVAAQHCHHATEQVAMGPQP